ncbi:hypothetical protein VB711_01805 [Cronbergia sp. UHCC 0137]|uniref:hypothetical protein n=1 Tax=Cronbergia sp. UHCC 0137 TaxID=3110239 RepID=UPI002B1EF307|nr:hypothetical protein [Cronbergia sp. UHCC 0137]MEA5616577.1 hypothetical protein [Cronbergia sp. UHCC 0137]
MQQTNSNDIALEDAKNTIAIFSTTMAFSIAIVYYIARIGFDNPILPILKTLSLSSFLLLLPQGYRFFSQKLQLNIKPSWLNCDAAISLWGLIIIIFLGIVASYLNLNLFILIFCIGFLLLAINYIIFWQPGTTRQNFRFILVTILFSLYIASFKYGTGYLNPLFTEGLIQKNAHIDQLFHAAISNIIKTYGIPSTGIDGLVYLPYHYGSHWLFAHLSSLLNMEILIFYQLAYPVIIVPFFFQKILEFSFDFRRKFINDSVDIKLRINWLLWFIFFLGFLGFIPRVLSFQAGFWVFSPLSAESHVTAFAISFMAFSLALQVNINSLYHNNISWIEAILPALVLPCLISTVAILKISVGVLLFCVSIYLVVRFKLYKSKVYVTSLFILTVMFATAFLLAKNPSPSPFKLFAFIQDWVEDPWKPFWFHLTFFWSWIYIIFVVKMKNIKNIKDFITAINQFMVIDIEVILLLCIVGAAPGMLLQIGGGSAYYFTDFQIVFSLSLLIANIPNIKTFSNKVYEKR